MDSEGGVHPPYHSLRPRNLRFRLVPARRREQRLPMGKILPFRRRRWTRTKDYGRFEPPITARGLIRDTFGWLRVLRPFILGGILLSVWPALDPALIEPPAFLSTEPEVVSATFTRCGPGRGHACVIDGDTFKLGTRKIRIVGIDTPETEARCPEEARLAEAATARLQELLSQGPFEMVGRIDDSRDRYGRELRSLRQSESDSRGSSIAEIMREEGHARRYIGTKRSWC